jgi:hypothetical protein
MTLTLSPRWQNPAKISATTGESSGWITQPIGFSMMNRIGFQGFWLTF